MLLIDYSNNQEDASTPDSPVMEYTCHWGGVPHQCHLRHGKPTDIGDHLRAAHGLGNFPKGVKVCCLWPNCGKQLKKESFSKHVGGHLESLKVRCRRCNNKYSRSDSERRHLKSDKCKADTEWVVATTSDVDTRRPTKKRRTRI
jgi:hypothetical protein